MPATGFCLRIQGAFVKINLLMDTHFETAFLQGFITVLEYDETVVFIG